MDSKGIAELLEPIVKEKGLCLIDIEMRQHGQGQLVQVFLDRRGGITLDECAWVNARLRERLELHDSNADSYRLEISSPGIDRKLKGPADAQLAVGSRVKAWTSEALEGNLEHGGDLVCVDDDTLTIEIGAGQRITIPWKKITTVRLDPDLWGGEKE